MSIPALSFSSSPAMCEGVPFPTEAKGYLPGYFLAAATISWSVVAGAFGLAAIS